MNDLVRRYELVCPANADGSASATLTAGIWGDLLELPKNGTLFVDLWKAPWIDPECAFAAIGGLLAVLGRSFFSDKHVVVTRASRRALAAVRQAVDQVGEAFMYIDESFQARIDGSGFVRALRDAHAVLDELNRPMTAADVARELAKRGTPVTTTAASARLAELYRLGFLIRTETSGTGGRPGYQYATYDPVQLWKSELERLPLPASR